jgi:bile acid-coenzyme A ligase
MTETVPVSYGRRVTELARAHPEGSALVDVGVDGAERRLSWTELETAAVRSAERLAGSGLGPGDQLAIVLPNCLEHVLACIAAWKLGAIPVSLRWDLPDWERRRVLEVLRPRLTVGDRRDVVLDGGPSPPSALPDVVSPHRFGVCTSGSTGTPKVVLHASPGLWRPGDPSTSAVVEDYGPLSAPQRLLVANALYHSSSITTATLNLVSGSTTIVLERFDPEPFGAIVARHRVSGFMAPTPLLLRLARRHDLDRRALESLEWVQHGAAPLPAWLARFWIDLLGAERFFTSYGSAEGIGVIACRGDEWLAHPGTLGRGALGTEVAVLDEEGSMVPPGTVGSLYLRRPDGPAGRYVGHGVAPLDVRGDGLATVGDLGWVDEDGFVYLADRRVDLIVTGGANVYPAEVEAALGEHPGVADVVVIGLPDPEWGRRVHAIVVPEPSGQVDAEDLRQFARARLARYKVPKTIEIVAGLPRSAAMKVNRARLIEERTT